MSTDLKEDDEEEEVVLEDADYRYWCISRVYFLLVAVLMATWVVANTYNLNSTCDCGENFVGTQE